MKSFVHEVLPGRVVFGAGCLDRVADEVADASRVLVIAGGSAKAAGERIADLLGERFAASFGEVRQHVPAELAAEARSTAQAASADAVVAVGGGSAIGLAKAVALETAIAVLAVPTTYSGSECTPIYGITGTHKRTGRDPGVLPRVILYDPALTTNLPAEVTGASGFNALAHAVEALYAPGTNPVISLIAEEAIRVLARALPAAVAEPADLEARSQALYGAYLAGCSLQAGIALHHKLCHVLGGTFGLDHGRTNAVVLPHVAKFNASPHSDRLRDLAAELGTPTSLAEIGMPAHGLDQAAELAVEAVGNTNPRPVDRDSLRELLQAAYEGRLS